MSNSMNSEKYVAIPLSDNSHSSTVTEEKLVHRHSEFTGSTSKKAAKYSKSTGTAKNKLHHPNVEMLN
ncbi:hypothetical protein DPMN_069336 [Dreissena polymorpha]|uniref:Uncharacterized protein n=1 Tax=Dreissena polymorpha TaxID=45954 RepID=A0A9D3Z321_DREPO|nr:hypothetical protein DPMN_069336 [Dreissena polymorpha]